MPDPDPHPPKPRAVSPARWLLLLSPSALLIGLPLVAGLYDHRSVTGWRNVFATLAFINLLVSPILCFVLGFCLEYWLRGRINSIVWAINYGFIIFSVNGVICFAGCNAVAHFQTR